MHWNTKYAYSILFSGCMVLLFVSGLCSSLHHRFNDLLYQQTGVTNPDIVIIGIEASTIDSLGGFPFDRQYYAQLLDILWEQETPPLAVAVDVLFTGETNTASDLALVQTIEGRDNIILACSANYTTQLVLYTATDFYLDNAYISSMNYPFPSLQEVARLGHINSTLDEDGYLRHSILTIDSPEGEEISALHYEMYKCYLESKGELSPSLPSNRWYVPFQSTSGGYYDGYSFERVLSGEIPPSVFGGKMVFIGPYTIGLQDHFYTAIDHTNLMYGVEYQANALEALINQRFVQTFPLYGEAMLLLVVCLFATLLCYGKKLRFTGLFLLGTGVLYLLICKQVYHLGYLLHVFYIPLALLLIFISNIVLDAIQSSVEKARITDTFKRYVAPEVVEEILNSEEDARKLGGVTRNISVMFLDIRGFTTLSEHPDYREDPQKLVSLLNQFMDVMASTITENGGTLDKFIGDAIMCFWGAPLTLTSQEHTGKAVETALQIVRNIQQVSQEVEKNSNQKIVIGIGIQCGDAVVGNIGSHNRMDYTVIGDTVNTAQRLESNAKVKEGETPRNLIVVSDAVYQLQKENFTFTKIPEGLKLKGKEELLEAYHVIPPS